MNNNIILKISNLSKSFGGIKALNNISIEIKKNTITALIGPNGSGKTTLFNIITNLIKPDSGKIEFFNSKTIEIIRVPVYKMLDLGIVRTFQHPRIFSKMTVLENILVGFKYRNEELPLLQLFRGKKDKFEEDTFLEKAKKTLELVELNTHENKIAENLSYGQRKLLELSRAIISNANLILLDEPFAGIFSEMKKKIFEIINLMKKNGKTIIFIEHDIESVKKIADNVIVLNQGEKINEGLPNELLSDEKIIDLYIRNESKN